MSDGALLLDWETRSAVDLRRYGVYVYAADPTTEALMASYRIGRGPVKRWLRGQPCPDDIRRHVEAGGMIHAFNAAFERLIWWHVMGPRGWPKPVIEQFRCSAAAAAAMSLPRDLARLGEALALNQKKDKEGSRLIRKFSVPRKPKKHEPDGLYFNEPEDNREDFERFRDYCDVDVLTEEEASGRCVPLSDYEQSVYVLGETINDRGIRVDVASARAAIRLVAKAKKKLDARMAEITNGHVPACSNPGKLVEWCELQGFPCGSAEKPVLEEYLERDDLPDNVREAVETRLEAAKTSVTKLEAMLRRSSADGRLRGAYVYHAAGTGRFQSTGVNLANLPRPRKAFSDAFEDGEIGYPQLFRTLRSEDPDLLAMLYGDEIGRPLHLVSDAIRGFLWAAPGHEFVQADYSGIEGAVTSWLAGETWKVEAMHEIIADPSLPDMYRRTAASIMNTTTDVVTKKHPYRQSVGKVSELALGFGGGVAAFASMAKVYGVNLNDMAKPVLETADEERIEKAAKRYETNVKLKREQADNMDRAAWMACEIVKVGWRQQNSATAAAWKALEGAAREAIRNPGQVFEVLKAKYVVKMGFLWFMLPSGRCLAYGMPKLSSQVWASRKVDGEWLPDEVMDRELAEKLAVRDLCKISGDTSPKITVLGVDSQTKKWRRYPLYGGLQMENYAQAFARDILVNGMFAAEAAGYPIVMHVYDEMVAEVPRGFGDLKQFERLICELPAWARGGPGEMDLPLTAGGFRSKRYKKD